MSAHYLPTAFHIMILATRPTHGLTIFARVVLSTGTPSGAPHEPRMRGRIPMQGFKGGARSRRYGLAINSR